MNAPGPIRPAELEPADPSLFPAAPTVRTTCPYCGVGCGVLATPDNLGGAIIAGDPEHPANLGRLCSKGAALGETLGLETRLLHPMARGADGELRSVGWDDALDRIASAFTETIERHGPDSVALYLSGQLLTEDYYAANKLAKGFLGTANVDTNSRLCMASSVAGHRRAFGSDTVPGAYEDLDEADLVVLVGSNAAWCHPVLFRRIEAARAKRGTKVVVIDPRRTATGDEADLFLPVAAGMDSVLFSGVLVWLAEHGALDEDFVASHTTGFAEAVDAARRLAPDVAAVARQTGLAAGDVAAFCRLFTTTERVVTCYSQGVNQSAQGTDKVNAIINVHLATGRIGRAGMGPFSLTGQPNAMGGREVGGLANQLAAHMDFAPESVDRVRRFWQAPQIATREGLKAVALFDAIAAGKVKALWVMGTNPAVSLPQADAVREAMVGLDFFVVSDNVASNDTLGCHPHLVLPALAWGEKDGTVTNSERRISRQRPFLPPPGEAKADWWAIAQVGRRFGHREAFAWRSVADVFREHAALSAFENDGTRDFDLSGLTGIDDPTFDDLRPVQWPVRDADSAATKRFFADGRFYTADGKARFIVPTTPRLAAAVDETYPFLLNTGRTRDQWHTMTRSGLSPKLGAHRPVPFVEINSADAARLGIAEGGFVRVASDQGVVILEAHIEPGQPVGTVFAPIHWSGETSSSGRVGALVSGATDPLSGQPEAKATPVALAPIDLPYRGFVLSRHRLNAPPADWWVRTAISCGHGYLLAGAGPLRDLVKAWVNPRHRDDRAASYEDRHAGRYRLAIFDRLGAIEAVAFAEPAEMRLDWSAALQLFARGPLSREERRNVLSGQLGTSSSCGAILCACHGVTDQAVAQIIAAGSAVDVATVGSELKAGTGCGSCIPEIRRLLAAG